MKLLREYIRSLLEADFGEKFKPDKVINPDGIERHSYPDGFDYEFELDTDEEKSVYKTLWHFIMGGAGERQDDAGNVAGENMDVILQAMDDTRYNDVFARYPAPGFTNPFPVRGSMMTPSQLDKILPTWRQMVYDFRVNDPQGLGLHDKDPRHGFDIEDEEPYNWGDEPEYWSPVIDTKYTYISRAPGGLSHWSRDPMVAHDFALGEYGGKAIEERMIPVILYANRNASANDFLDMARLYQYKPFSRLQKENEVIGFGPIEVVGVEIYLPNYADLGPKAKLTGTREDMKEIRSYVRELLTESTIHPKIMSMIDRAEERGLKVYVKDNGDWGTAILGTPKGDDPRPSGDFIAALGWSKPPSNYSGECSGAMEVNNSRATDGFGPLVYDVAIEATGGLMADRQEVSGEAEEVWRRYATTRGDVQADQLDILDSFEEPQLTPKYTEDDCDQVPAFDRHGSDWHKSPLTKVIRKAGTPVMDELRRRGMLQE